jgi:heterodisulfide reductase subunit B
MKFSYYPGCTLKNKAKNFDISAKKCAEILGFELVEVDDFQCCGGVFTTSADEIATKLSTVRTLKAAKAAGTPLVTVCSACHNVIKQTNHAMKTDPVFADRVNRYINDGDDYHGETKVYHYLEVLRDIVGFDKVKEYVKYPLDMDIGAYYGCLMLRPGAVIEMDDTENPQIMEQLIKALGGRPVEYGNRNECCGGYISVTDPGFAEKRSRIIYESAKAAGAELIVTACPLCRYNLIKNGADIPVMYFTELLYKALIGE